MGIGASAGGLEAFTQLLTHLPTDTGMGFVLVQHLDPAHESVLAQILSRATKMPVREVRNNQRVEPNRVHIIPPNTRLSIAQGILKLRPRERGRTPTHSIDGFFESLAQDQGERAIGVVLSGTATDGTVGLEAIKAEGGIAFAQDESAKYDSMPRSAVAAGCVDFVLSPAKIAHELARIAKHPYVGGRPVFSSAEAGRADATAPKDDATPLPSGGRESRRTAATHPPGKGEATRARSAEDGFNRIVLQLRNRFGVDFSLYKSTTIQRRIARRMMVNKQDGWNDYAQFLQGNPKELDALYSDVLIGVTSFFRNPEAFEALKRKVFPKLLQRRGDGPLRVWTTGCSTGQEAYSIAMAFVEAAEHAPRQCKLQVFATDLNEVLLDKARHGLYARNLTQDISPERLRRFFVEEESGYQLIKSLREMVVFARHNLMTDPPFSRMDLISCRNLLIYLEPVLQRTVLPTFHYALKPEGFLFLGASESIVGYTDLFKPLDKKTKIFSRNAAATPRFSVPLDKQRTEVERVAPRPPGADKPRGGARTALLRDRRLNLPAELSAQREADRVMVNQFAPPGVLINTQMQILQFRGPTSAYLEPPTGKASFDVLKMAREGLMLPLRAVINKAKKEKKPARKENVRLNHNGATRRVNVEVIPLKNLREPCFLVLFAETRGHGRKDVTESGKGAQEPRRVLGPAGRADEGARRRISELETEVAETRDYLQAIQEQHEAANEELQSANEEVQSANEELQSVNEELETSKEELESSNEELTTINEEMAHRNAELSRLNSDLVNLQTSTRLAIVLLARDLTIRRYSAQAEKLFDFLAADIGRPLGRIRHGLVFETHGGAPETLDSPPDLESFVAEVIQSVREREHEVRDKDGRWYSLRVRPYITLDNKVDGAVLVLVNISELKRTEREMAAARDYAESILRTARDSLVVLRADLHVNTANDAFYTTFNTTPVETEGMSIFELNRGAWRSPELRTLLEDIVPRDTFFNDFEMTQDFPEFGRRTLLLNARRLDLHDGTPIMILLAIEDVTERKGVEEALRRSHAELASHAAELDRFNRVAVGREVRMIELKKEINELCRRHGETTRYPLEFEQDEKHADARPLHARDETP